MPLSPPSAKATRFHVNKSPSSPPQFAPATNAGEHRQNGTEQCSYAALREVSIASSATRCFGLKTSAKTDPTPKPTRKKVTAEYRSYSLFVAFSISTSLHGLCEMRSGEPLCRLQEPCHFPKAVLGLPLRRPSLRMGLGMSPVGRHERQASPCFSPTLPPRRESRMRINDRVILSRSRLLLHDWSLSWLGGLAHAIFLTPEPRGNDSSCF